MTTTSRNPAGNVATDLVAHGTDGREVTMSPHVYDRDADLLLGRFAHRNRADADIDGVDGVDGGVVDGLRAAGDGRGADGGAAYQP